MVFSRPTGSSRGVGGGGDDLRYGQIKEMCFKVLFLSANISVGA